jgi:ankyrin repeat protein
MKFSQEDIDNFVNHAGYDDGLRFVREFVQRYGSEVLTLQNSRAETAFVRAAHFGKIEILDYLASAGAAAPETHQEQPFIVWMARNGSVEGLRWLVGRGAAINVTSGKENATALMHSVLRGGPDEAINILIAGGADVNAVDTRGRTAVFHAAMLGKGQGNIKTLAAQGANVNVRDNDLATPLHLAMLFRNTSAMAELLECGADTTIKDANGKTCLDLAAERDLTAIFEAECNRMAGQFSQGTSAKISIRTSLKFKQPK